MNAIEGFFGEYRFLSNFWISDLRVPWGSFRSAEHAYQAAKTCNPDERAMIARAPSPGTAKRLARSIVHPAPLFDTIKLRIMREVVTAKFEQNSTLADLLIQTAPRKLVELNSWGDRFWGVFDGVGENHLGAILEGVRAELAK